VATVLDRADSCLERLPSLFVVQGSPHGFSDETAPAPGPDALVEPAHIALCKRNVYTHGHKLAHTFAWTARGS